MSDFEKRAARAAIILSLGVHAVLFVLGLILVALGALQNTEARVAPEEEYIVLDPEMFLVENDESESRQLIDTSAMHEANAAPETTNLSDRNTTASSTEAPSPDAVDQSTIAQAGEVEHGMDVANRDFLDAPEDGDPTPPGGAPQPPTPMSAQVQVQPLDEVVPEPETKKQDIDQPKDVVEGEEIFDNIGDGDLLPLPEVRAQLGGTPEPRKDDIREKPPTPEEATPPPVRPGSETDTAFVPEMKKRTINGTITTRGDGSFDAKDTPLGRYASLVRKNISRKWQAQVAANRGFASYSDLRVSFRIDKDGSVNDLRVVRSQANAIVKDFTLSAILEADIPPIPDDLWDILDGEQIEMNYDVVIY